MTSYVIDLVRLFGIFGSRANKALQSHCSAVERIDGKKDGCGRHCEIPAAAEVRRPREALEADGGSIGAGLVPQPPQSVQVTQRDLIGRSLGLQSEPEPPQRLQVRIELGAPAEAADPGWGCGAAKGELAGHAAGERRI